MKRAFLLLLSLTITLQLIACASGADGESEDTGSVTQHTENASEAEKNPDDDDLPDMDYEGYNFRVFSRNTAWFHGNILVEEYTGDVFNDALHNRNLTVSQRFNITLTEEGG